MTFDLSSDSFSGGRRRLQCDCGAVGAINRSVSVRGKSKHEDPLVADSQCAVCRDICISTNTAQGLSSGPGNVAGGYKVLLPEHQEIAQGPSKL